MTGMPAVAGSSFKSFKTSKPSSLGMTTSRRTRSSRSARAIRKNRSSSARRTRRAPSGTLPRQQAADQLAQLLQRQVRLHEVAGDPEVADLGDVLLARGIREDEHLHG